MSQAWQPEPGDVVYACPEWADADTPALPYRRLRPTDFAYVIVRVAEVLWAVRLDDRDPSRAGLPVELQFDPAMFAQTQAGALRLSARGPQKREADARMLADAIEHAARNAEAAP